MRRKKKACGAEAFDEFYSSLFPSRWESSLKAALSSEPLYCELGFPGRESYFLDAGSVCAAMCLPLSGAERILDLCAAPGGKTLVLAGGMDGGARLCSNERSFQRKERLRRVVRDSLPEEISSRVEVSCSDGSAWCRTRGCEFDRILVDAPCSSERHVLADSRHLSEWTPSRARAMTFAQKALSSCAFMLLKPGGFMVYATCALCPDENDGIVSRLARKFPSARILGFSEAEKFIGENSGRFCGSLSIPGGRAPLEVFARSERTEFGFHILPDSGGAGPIYFSLLQKVLV